MTDHDRVDVTLYNAEFFTRRLRSTAEWRRGAGGEYPEDDRNAPSAEALERLADQVPQDAELAQLANLIVVVAPGDEDYLPGEEASRLLGRYGFGHSQEPGAFLSDVLNAELDARIEFGDVLPPNERIGDLEALRDYLEAVGRTDLAERVDSALAEYPWPPVTIDASVLADLLIAATNYHFHEGGTEPGWRANLPETLRTAWIALHGVDMELTHIAQYVTDGDVGELFG